MQTQEIINQIESLLIQLKTSLNLEGKSIGKRQPQHLENKNQQKFIGLTAHIYELVQEGFFKEDKSLAQIQKKHQERGVKKPTTALMNPVLQLIRKKLLDREKPEKGQYKYFKR